MEKYSPCETTLEVTTPDGLNDTSLAASFPLHTATPSASSSRLDEINEDEDEEPGPQTRTPTSQATSNGSYFASQRHRKDRRSERSPPPVIHVRDHSSDRASTTPTQASSSQFSAQQNPRQQSISSMISTSTAPVSQNATVDDSRDALSNAEGSETPRAATTPTTPKFKPLPSAPPEAASVPEVPQKSSERFSKPTEVRMPKGLPDQQTVDRPATSATISTMASMASENSKYEDDAYDFSRFDIKPKQKLGPRPVAPGEKTKRPTVASISSVPATYRPTSKKPEPRPQSQTPVAAAVLATGAPKGIPAPPPIPDLPEYNPRPLSRGSIKSLPSHKSTGMTPDKIRLMKAVELRKKQLRKSNPQANTFVPPPDEDTPSVPAIPEPAQKQEAPSQKRNKPRTTAIETPDEPAPRPVAAVAEEHILAKKADSGISMEYDGSQTKIEEQPLEVKPLQEPQEPQIPPTSSDRKTSSMPEPPSPKVDTPRDLIGQFPQDDRPPSHIANVPTKASPSEEKYAPLGSGVSPVETSAMPGGLEELNPEAIILHEDDGQAHGPTLPTSRHALPMEDTPRNQSIDSRASEDDSANVPTIIMGDGSRPLSALIREARSEDSSDSESEPEEKTFYESANSSSDLGPPQQELHKKSSDLVRRRRGYIEPIHVDGDIEFDSDEEFMDELQSATVQQAKPITVARSPVAHYFPRRPSNNSALSDLDVNSIRTVTVGERGSILPNDYTDSQGRLSPDAGADSPGPDRSISTVSTERYEPMASFKRNVSNGISRRIQALAETASQERISPSSSRPTSLEVVMNGVSNKDARSTTRSPPPVDSRTSSFRAMSRHSSRISAYQSLMGGASPPATETNNTVWNVENDEQGGVGSVSVTARIVRPTTNESVSPKSDEDAELQPSQLVVSSHKRAAPSQSSARYLQRIDTEQKLDESSASRNVSPVVVRGSVDTTRLSQPTSKFSRISEISPTVEDFPVPPPSSKPPVGRATHAPAQSIDESAVHKEGTKTSRFFKRMSNINLGNKRRSTITQSVASSASPASERGSVVPNNLPGSKDKSDLPPARTVGDLNIQFPDSLVSQASKYILSCTLTIL